MKQEIERRQPELQLRNDVATYLDLACLAVLSVSGYLTYFSIATLCRSAGVRLARSNNNDRTWKKQSKKEAERMPYVEEKRRKRRGENLNYEQGFVMIDIQINRYLVRLSYSPTVKSHLR